MYDIISPPYGRMATLEKLFTLLGYERAGATFQTRGRRAIILGNVVPMDASEAELRRTYNLLAPMTEQGSVIVLLGPVDFHSLTNRPVSPATLSEFDQWRFTFPLWIEGNGFRATYGAWLDSEIRILNSTLIGRRIQRDRVSLLTREGQRTGEALQRILTYSDQLALAGGARSDCTEPDPPEFSYPAEAPPLFVGRSYSGIASIVVENRCYLHSGSDSRQPLRAYRWTDNGSFAPTNLLEVR